MILIPGKREIMGLLLNEHELKGQAKLIQGGMQKHVQNRKQLKLNFIILKFSKLIYPEIKGTPRVFNPPL